MQFLSFPIVKSLSLRCFLGFATSSEEANAAFGGPKGAIPPRPWAQAHPSARRLRRLGGSGPQMPSAALRAASGGASAGGHRGLSGPSGRLRGGIIAPLPTR